MFSLGPSRSRRESNPWPATFGSFGAPCTAPELCLEFGRRTLGRRPTTVVPLGYCGGQGRRKAPLDAERSAAFQIVRVCVGVGVLLLYRCPRLLSLFIGICCLGLASCKYLYWEVVLAVSPDMASVLCWHWPFAGCGCTWVSYDVFMYVCR